MALGVNISKANLAVESHPTPGVLIGKANMAINSRPHSAWVVIGKANLSVQSEPATGFTLSADGGSYALTGSSLAPKFARTMKMYNELVVNGKFPLNTDGWIVDGADTTFTSIDGVGVLDLGPAAADGYAYQQVTVNPGQRYTLSAFLRPTNAYRLTATPGAYSITGTAATLTTGTGGGGDPVTFSGDSVVGTRYAQWTLSFDGYIYKRHNSGAAVQSGSWISPQIGMSDYEVRATLVSGDDPGGSQGVWVDVGQTWGFTDTDIDQSCTLLIEIRRKSDHVVVASGNVNIFAAGIL